LIILQENLTWFGRTALLKAFMKSNLSKLYKLGCCLTFALTSWAGPAFAVQQHGGAEGLVSHQVGHILFIAGMSYLLYRVYNNSIRGRGWFEFKAFLWLIILWNFLTFSGHWMREIVEPEKFLKEGAQVTAFAVTDSFDTFFYLTRLDHLLLVPSFIFLFFALQKWRRMK
jgi:hypothetical protein